MLLGQRLKRRNYNISNNSDDDVDDDSDFDYVFKVKTICTFHMNNKRAAFTHSRRVRHFVFDVLYANIQFLWWP